MQAIRRLSVTDWGCLFWSLVLTSPCWVPAVVLLCIVVGSAILSLF